MNSYNGELSKVKDSIARQVQEIMQTYREQEASRGGVDTPGGLEHMGDVWRLLGKWDKQLADAAAAEAGRTER